MALIIRIARLSRRVRLPETVGLPLSGVVLGPHVLDVFPERIRSSCASPNSACCCWCSSRGWKLTWRCFGKRCSGRRGEWVPPRRWRVRARQAGTRQHGKKGAADLAAQKIGLLCNGW